MAAAATVGALDLARRRFRQTQLFLPEREPVRSWSPADYGLDPDRVEELRFESGDGVPLYGWYCRAEKPVASALFCHGNRGNITVSADAVAKVVARGISILHFDYRGYGRSAGLPTPYGLLRDAVAAARLHDRLRDASLPSISYGYSLGGPIAAATAERIPFDGLVLQSTFTNLRDIARIRYPRFPLHLISGNPFDTRRSLRNLQLPTLLIHGTSDAVCPYDMASRLQEFAPQSLVLPIDNGEHCNLFDVAPDEITATLWAFATNLTSHEPVAHAEPELFERAMAALRHLQRPATDEARAKIQEPDALPQRAAQ